MIAGNDGSTVASAAGASAFERQRNNPGVTELEVFTGRSHPQQLDSG